MKKKSWGKLLMQAVEQQGESLPLQPILELCGYQRIWIENHKGVREYTHDRICVAVRYGQLVISGSCLHLKQMQLQILTITGNIESITVEKRCK